MNSPRFAFPVLVLAAVLVAAPARGQKTPGPAPKATEAPQEEVVSEKGFASRVVEIKHRDPQDLAAVVRPLGSGFRGAAVYPSHQFRTITIRDFPENIAAIEAALKRLDVAEAARADVELHLWVLVGSGEPGGGAFPEELKEAVAALKATLAYKHYSLAGSFVQRVRDGARGIEGQGVTDLGQTSVNGKASRAMQLEYRINQLSLDQAGSGAASIRLDGFSLVLVGEGRAQLKTDATLREGEKVVLGTSTVRDRALVVVVSGRVIK